MIKILAVLLCIFVAGAQLILPTTVDGVNNFPVVKDSYILGNGGNKNVNFGVESTLVVSDKKQKGIGLISFTFPHGSRSFPDSGVDCYDLPYASIKNATLNFNIVSTTDCEGGCRFKVHKLIYDFDELAVTWVCNNLACDDSTQGGNYQVLASDPLFVVYPGQTSVSIDISNFVKTNKGVLGFAIVGDKIDDLKKDGFVLFSSKESFYRPKVSTHNGDYDYLYGAADLEPSIISVQPNGLDALDYSVTTITGSGTRTVLMFVGLFSTRRAWKDVVHLVAPNAARVLVIEHVGQGAAGRPLFPIFVSQQPEFEYNMDDLEPYTDQLFKDLNIQDADVYGWDWGTQQALIGCTQDTSRCRKIRFWDSWVVGECPDVSGIRSSSLECVMNPLAGKCVKDSILPCLQYGQMHGFINAPSQSGLTRGLAEDAALGGVDVFFNGNSSGPSTSLVLRTLSQQDKDAFRAPYDPLFANGASLASNGQLTVAQRNLPYAPDGTLNYPLGDGLRKEYSLNRTLEYTEILKQGNPKFSFLIYDNEFSSTSFFASDEQVLATVAAYTNSEAVCLAPNPEAYPASVGSSKLHWFGVTYPRVLAELINRELATV